MKLISILPAALLSAGSLLPLALAATSWAGVNHYYLASLPYPDMVEAIETFKNNNVAVVRTFISSEDNTCEKNDQVEKHADVESVIGGSLNQDVMERYDTMLVELKKAGIKVRGLNDKSYRD